MPENHSDPANTAVKPAIETLEGKIALGVTALTSVSAALAVVVSAYPNNEHVKIAALVIAVLLAALGAFVAKGHADSRADVKQTANVVAGTLALADKAAAIAKDNPALAELLLRGAGIGGSVPQKPAAGP